MADARRWTKQLRRYWPTLLIAAAIILTAGILIGREEKKLEIRLDGDIGVAINSPRVLRAERIAQTIFPNVCGGKVAIAVAQLAGNQAGRASWQIEEDRSFTRCAIIIAPKGPDGKPWPFSALCAIVTHEHGHLAGLRHSTNPASVMFPRISKRNVPRRCR